MRSLSLPCDPAAPLNTLCLGAHSDDIEIGCGGTILRLTQLYPGASIQWIVCSADGTARKNEAVAGASLFLERAGYRSVVVKGFRESFFPFAGAEIKEYFEQLKSGDT